MLVIMVSADLCPSYLVNRNRTRLNEAAAAYFLALGERFAVANPRSDDPNILDFGFYPHEDGTPQNITQQIVETFFAQHDNAILTDNQKKNNQTEAAAANLLPHLDALINLPAADVGYAAMGRAMAFKDGASGVVINGIVDRATAAAYLTSKTEWINLPATSKAWVADELEMFAFLFQVLVLVLKR